VMIVTFNHLGSLERAVGTDDVAIED